MKTLYTFFYVIVAINVANAEVKSFTSDTIQKNISVFQADSLIKSNKNNPDFHILDVRTQTEFSTGYIENAVNIDFYSPTFSSVIDTYDKNKIYLVHCKGGSRSIQVYNQMIIKKFREVYNMLGGIVEWKAEGYPVSPITNMNTEKVIENKFLVYPVSAKDFLTIKANPENINSELFMYDCSGKLMLRCMITSSITTIHVSNLQSGIYFVKLITDKIVEIKKIFKQ